MNEDNRGARWGVQVWPAEGGPVTAYPSVGDAMAALGIPFEGTERHYELRRAAIAARPEPVLSDGHYWTVWRRL